MLRRLTFLVPPIVFVAQMVLVSIALIVGHLRDNSLLYFLWEAPAAVGYPHPIVMVSDGYFTMPIIDLEERPIGLFAGPDDTIYAEKEGWLYRIENTLQPVCPLLDHIANRVTWTDDDRLIYSNGEDIVMMSMRTCEHDTLASGERVYFNPTLSADGAMLAFVSGTHPYFSDVMLMAMTTRNTRPLAQGVKPIWSPDGTRLLFRDGDSVYHIYDRATDRMTPLPATFIPHMLGYRVLWMPDSRHLLYTAPDSGRLALQTLNIETLATNRLTAIHTHNTLPSISPDGEWVAYSSDRDGEPMMFLLHISDRRVINTGIPVDWRARRLVWSPSGRYVAFATVNPNSDGQIVRYDLRTGRTLYGISADWYFGGVVWQMDALPPVQSALVCR